MPLDEVKEEPFGVVEVLVPCGLGLLDGTILFDELGTTDDGSLHQRNVTIFADGEVDRSPCASGSASRVAVLAARGDLAPGQALVHDSVVGSTFVPGFVLR
jgi:proline racemase